MTLTPSQLKSFCTAYHLMPSKKYGQNYLISDGPIIKMIAAAGVCASDTVVEVGPGFGVLTFALAQKAKRVIAYEIEQKLKPYWEEEQKKYTNIEVVWGNVLKEYPQMQHALPDTYTLVANLPYQITSQLLRTFLEASHKPKRIVVMVQKEVAQRICAKPGDMSLLAVSVQYYGNPRIVTSVPSGNFWPQPQVDSAVVAIDDIQEKPYSDLFFAVVRAGFANKRKQLWRNLSEGLAHDGTYIKGMLEEIGVDQKIRAQALTIAQWEALVAKISTVQL